ncbi:MAG: flavodoxin family protein [Actinomycetes bacterium]
MQVVIIYESLTGNTERAARLIADAFFDRGVASKIFPVGAADPQAISSADLVIAGSWTDGLFVVGQKPAKRKKFAQLPELSNKRCVVFCTYALDPGKTLDKLSAVLSKNGADVLGGMAIKRSNLADDANEFVERVMQLAPA